VRVRVVRGEFVSEILFFFWLEESEEKGRKGRQKTNCKKKQKKRKMGCSLKRVANFFCTAVSRTLCSFLLRCCERKRKRKKRKRRRGEEDDGLVGVRGSDGVGWALSPVFCVQRAPVLDEENAAE
jgi:hypothetical protein